jgi:signal transduction histidine kinase
VVSLFATRDGVAVTVSDDGVGLPDGVAKTVAAKARSGLGLAAVTEQVARVGGNVTLSDNEDGGVTVKAWIPT